MFDRNINTKGRIIRGLGGLALLAGSAAGFLVGNWLGWLMIASSALLIFQAVRGWCMMRACGIQTRL